MDVVLGPLEPPQKPKDAVPPPKLKLNSAIMVTKPKEEKKVEQEKPPKVKVWKNITTMTIIIS